MATAKKTVTARKARLRKPSGKAVASSAFVSITDAGYRVVRAGEELDASDELVKANPDQFESKK